MVVTMTITMMMTMMVTIISLCNAIAGADPYARCVPGNRDVPLWGGVSRGGFSIVTCHANKKMKTEEWVDTLRQNKLRAAIKELRPVRKAGPRSVICDNEGFLRARAAKKEYDCLRVTLWKLPPRSPDLNPVEQFWGWLRKRLRAMDLQDAVRKRPVLGKTAYKLRVRRLCASRRAQRVAANVAGTLKKVCREVIAKKGAATKVDTGGMTLRAVASCEVNAC